MEDESGSSSSSYYMVVTFDDSLVGEIGEEMPFHVPSLEKGKKVKALLCYNNIVLETPAIYKTNSGKTCASPFNELIKIATSILEARFEKAAQGVSGAQDAKNAFKAAAEMVFL